jgi:hypothetical protein
MGQLYSMVRQLLPACALGVSTAGTCMPARGAHLCAHLVATLSCASIVSSCHPVDVQFSSFCSSMLHGPGPCAAIPRDLTGRRCPGFWPVANDLQPCTNRGRAGFRCVRAPGCLLGLQVHALPRPATWALLAVGSWTLLYALCALPSSVHPMLCMLCPPCLVPCFVLRRARARQGP